MFPETPSYVEVSIVKWIAKWILLPIASIVGIVCGYDVYKTNMRCKEMCEQRGYKHYEVVSKGRYSGSKCVCTGKIDAFGNIDKNSKLEIDLN